MKKIDPKAPNYTDEMVATMYEKYTANPTRETVEELSQEFGKSTRSIIAKLCNMEIYVTPPRETKSGEPVVRKQDLVNEISKLMGVEAPSLIKANKRDLQNMAAALSILTTDMGVE